MDFQVGDRIVHHLYGPGEVIRFDEKEISGHTDLYYVVKSGNLTLWVPVGKKEKPSLRRLTPMNEFPKLFGILKAPAEPLSVERLERKAFLLEKMRDGTIESLCRVIRDLAAFKRLKKMSDYDVSIFERAQDYLLNEWKLVLSIPLAQAESELEQMLASSARNLIE